MFLFVLDPSQQRRNDAVNNAGTVIGMQWTHLSARCTWTEGAKMQ